MDRVAQKARPVGLQTCSPTNIQRQTHIPYLTTYTHTYSYTNYLLATLIIIHNNIIQQNSQLQNQPIYKLHVYKQTHIHLYNQSKKKATQGMAEWAGLYNFQYIIRNSLPQEGTVHKNEKR